MDIEDKSEVEYELSLLYWDDNDTNAALEHLGKAIDQNPNRMQYRMIRGTYLSGQKRVQKRPGRVQGGRRSLRHHPGSPLQLRAVPRKIRA